MGIGRKIIKITVNVLLWIVILCAAVVTLISITAKQSGVPDVFGLIPLSIQTESMEPEIMTGDLIVSKKYNSTEIPKLEVDQVITFFSVEQEKVITKTHRIIEVIDNAGVIQYRTKGDNNEYPDNELVAPGDIVAVYDGIKISKGGSVIDFLRSGTGFFICIVLPLLIFFLYQLYTFISLVSQMKYEQAVRNGKRNNNDDDDE